MANEQNLIPGSHKLTLEEQSKGGIASGKARREKKIFQQGIAERMGFDDFNEMIDNLIKRAKDSDKSFEVLRDTFGQKPKEQIEYIEEAKNPFDDMPLDELRNYLDKM